MARTRSKPTPKDALEMLTQDHKNVQKLFRKLKRAKEVDEQEEIVGLACEELTIHATLEEEIFYPAVRESTELGDLLDEAAVEHDVAKNLIEELQNMSADDELYAAKFKVLSEYMSHHIEEEETKLFPKVKRAKLDLAELGEQLYMRKQELMGEAEEVEEEDEEAA